MAPPTVSAAGMRIMKLLVGRPPQTVADLIDATGVTRTAVTEQLNELVASGWVEQGTQKLPGRGRPRHVYTATDHSMVALFANHHPLLVPAIWKVLQEIGGEELTAKVLRRVSHELAGHYKRRITASSPKKRLGKLAELFREEGALVETVEEKGRLVIYKRSCSFLSVLDEDRLVCYVDQAMMTEVVGRPIRRTSYRHEGAPCCSFEIGNHRRS